MPHIMQAKRSGCSLTLALLLVSDPVVGLSQDRKDAPYTAEEHAAFVTADLEKNPQAKIKLLDEFSVQVSGFDTLNGGCSRLLPNIFCA